MERRMTMRLSKSRIITLLVAFATLTSNSLSSLLFHQLPDDQYHLASKFGWYLHFANVMSIFGFLGAFRQHALCIAIFSNYLILDTILCCIPRFLVLGLLNELSSSLCAPPYVLFAPPNTNVLTSSFTSTLSSWDAILSSPPRCHQLVFLGQLTLAAAVIAATLLQFVGALVVREYARGLWMRDLREEELERATTDGRKLCDEWGVPVIYEVEYEDDIDNEK